MVRITPLFPVKRICVVTVKGQSELIREQLPEVLPEKIIEEPFGRNTALCIGLAAIHLKRINPDAVMVALPADHFIEREEPFCQALTLGITMAQRGRLVTLGIVPDHPAAGYGYIAAGDLLSGSQNAVKAYCVEHFTEKPSLSRAKTFLDKGNYYWNSGIFIWKVERILEEIARHMPELYSGLREIEKHWETPDSEQVTAEVYRGQKAVSIDHGVMEKVSRIDTKDSTVFSMQDRLIATIGLKDVIIIDTPEALLIMDRSRAQEVRAIVDRIEKEM
ncbi:sugar phosphate nucleotidyltransferase [Dehalococcoidia bacterium]|nr:sugar phosphate nucleotidyltransferase [Dehalococcoidia bacterium]